MTLDAESEEKVENQVENSKNGRAEENRVENSDETETQYARVQVLNDSPVNPSVDSSTDTLIPSNDSLVGVMNVDKET